MKVSRKADVIWSGGLTFDTVPGSGHKITIDGPPEMGGENTGARPKELVLIGLGGCSAMDVISILKKMRQNVESFSVEVQAEEEEEPPKGFSKIHLIYRLRGEGLDPKRVKRAVNLSQNKYCGVSHMLSKAAHITWEIQLNGAVLEE